VNSPDDAEPTQIPEQPHPVDKGGDQNSNAHANGTDRPCAVPVHEQPNGTATEHEKPTAPVSPTDQAYADGPRSSAQPPPVSLPVPGPSGQPPESARAVPAKTPLRKVLLIVGGIIIGTLCLCCAGGNLISKYGRQASHNSRASSPRTPSPTVTRRADNAVPIIPSPGSTATLSESAKASATASSASKDDLATAMPMCQRFVTKVLKAPATARYGAATSSFSDGWFRVAGDVDAQNSFGALLRSSYTCYMTKTGDREWNPIAIILDGHAVAEDLDAVSKRNAENISKMLSVATPEQRRAFETCMKEAGAASATTGLTLNQFRCSSQTFGDEETAVAGILA
jgi:hypothetical protein